jgi:Na+/glutamate symporter
MEWFFNGLGTALIGLLIGATGGGIIGYHIGIKKSHRQTQKARDNATQIQVGEVNRGQ